MKQLSGGRVSITCDDSPEDVAAFFDELRATRSGSASQPATGSGDGKASGGGS